LDYRVFITYFQNIISKKVKLMQEINLVLKLRYST
jgi:hypothetical protein